MWLLLEHNQTCLKRATLQRDWLSEITWRLQFVMLVTNTSLLTLFFSWEFASFSFCLGSFSPSPFQNWYWNSAQPHGWEAVCPLGSNLDREETWFFERNGYKNASDDDDDEASKLRKNHTSWFASVIAFNNPFKKSIRAQNIYRIFNRIQAQILTQHSYV